MVMSLKEAAKALEMEIVEEPILPGSLYLAQRISKKEAPILLECWGIDYEKQQVISTNLNLSYGCHECTKVEPKQVGWPDRFYRQQRGKWHEK